MLYLKNIKAYNYFLACLLVSFLTLSNLAGLSHMCSILRDGKYATSWPDLKTPATTADTSCFQARFWKTFDESIAPVCFKLKHPTAEHLTSLVIYIRPEVVH